MLLIEPQQLSVLEDGARLVHLVDREQLNERVSIKYFIIAMSPSQSRQEIDHCLREEATLAIVQHSRVTVTLGQASPICAEDHRQMHKPRYRPS